MVREFVDAREVEVDGRAYEVRYFESRTSRGGRRFSCEVLLDASDRIVLDDDSLSGLESKLARVVPATIYSRALAARRIVAA